MAKDKPQEDPKDPYTGEEKPPAEDADKIVEIVPVDTGEREGEEYLLEEETSMDAVAAEQDADAVAQRSARHTEATDIEEHFEDRQQLGVSGRDALEEELEVHTSKSPELSGGDLDADWQSASMAGEEAVGGTAPTPDQDVVDELGEALGITYEDDEPLAGAEKLRQRDRERWELDPESVEETSEIQAPIEQNFQTESKEEENRKKKENRSMNLKEGQIVEGKITRVVEEAAFIDIGTTHKAVIPRKDLDQLGPEQLANVQEGESIEVCIVHMPPNSANPLVSVAQTLDTVDQPSGQQDNGDPWHRINDTYQVGDLVKGKVKNIKKYGAFVELPIGIDGLIHVSEMQDGFTPSPWDVVQSGQHVTVRIIEIDLDRKRIGLSLKDVSEV